MKRKKNLNEVVLNEIKELAEKFKAKNGNSSLRIPNKDFNLWLVNWAIKQDGRIGKLETLTKLLTIFICGIIIRLIII
jgi:hypothetical protein